MNAVSNLAGPFLLAASHELYLKKRRPRNMVSVEGNTVAHILKRALRVLRTEGPRGIVQRLKDRARKLCSSVHLFVFASDTDSIARAMNGFKGLLEISRRLTPLDFKEIRFDENSEIDELTEIDPWKFPKLLTVKQLHEGCKCFVAKSEGRIVACICVWFNHSFRDDFLEREIVLGSSEAYYWRAFCVPYFRSTGILPRLLMHAIECLEDEQNRTKQIAWVRVTNTPMQRTLTYLGWKVVGRMGFVEILGVRFQYLWGREAAKDTRKRIFLQFSRKLSR